MDFEKFLRKQEYDLKFSIHQRSDDTSKEQLEWYLKGKAVEFEKFKLALGEWAWETWIKTPIQNSSWSVLHDIAVACLGKETIQKRLEALK